MRAMLRWCKTRETRPRWRRLRRRSCGRPPQSGCCRGGWALPFAARLGSSSLLLKNCAARRQQAREQRACTSAVESHCSGGGGGDGSTSTSSTSSSQQQQTASSSKQQQVSSSSKQASSKQRAAASSGPLRSASNPLHISEPTISYLFSTLGLWEGLADVVCVQKRFFLSFVCCVVVVVCMCDMGPTCTCSCNYTEIRFVTITNNHFKAFLGFFFAAPIRSTTTTTSPLVSFGFRCSSKIVEWPVIDDDWCQNNL